jgi:predicted nuclease of predicted toxin-antitoxin system
MRFLIDESAGPSLASWLSDQGHDVVSVYSEMRGFPDTAILSRAAAEQRILVTTDKDFGDRIYRDRFPHKGVVLLRIRDLRPASLIDALSKLLDAHAERIPDTFVVVSEARVRFARR